LRLRSAAIGQRWVGASKQQTVDVGGGLAVTYEQQHRVTVDEPSSG
jgi:hypothetical protein